MVYTAKGFKGSRLADPDEQSPRAPVVPRALRGQPRDLSALDRCALVVTELEALPGAQRDLAMARVNQILATGEITLPRLRQVERVVRQELRLQAKPKGKPRGRQAHQTKALASLADLVHKPWRSGLSILEIHALAEVERPGVTLDDVRKVVATLNAQEMSWSVGSEDEVDDGGV